MERSVRSDVTQVTDPNNMSLERRWFWIALLPMASLFLQIGTVTANVTATTGLEEAIIMGPGFALVIVGLMLAPILIKRWGMFDSFTKFRSFCTATAAVGTAAFTGFFISLALTENSPPTLCVGLIYISLLALSSLAGCTLHRAVKIISVRQAAVFSGFMTVGFVGFSLVINIFLVIFNYWSVFYITEPLVYAAPLIASVILLYRTSAAESDSYSPPPTAWYFSESLFVKFMAAMLMILLLEMFHDGSYYGGGTYTNIFTLIIQVGAFIMPAVTGILVTMLIRRKHWLPAAVAVVILICFEQGLVLFFSDVDQLAVAYAVASYFTSSCPLILALCVPAVYSAQRRGSARLVTGAISFWIGGTILNTAIAFISNSLGNAAGLIMLVKPAMTFTLSIIAIGYLFYLYNENHKVYIAKLYALLNVSEIAATEEGDGEAIIIAESPLTAIERQITHMIIKGDSLNAIAKNLNLPEDEAHRRFAAIQGKVARLGGQESREEIFERYKLTKREREAATYLLTGELVKNISDSMGIRESTVKFHSKNLYRKLGIQSRNELAAIFNETVPDVTDEDETDV